MKNLNLFIGIAFLTMTSIQSHSQEFTLDGKTIIGVFNAKNKTKSEIFSSINKWISLNYNSAQSVTQLNDKEAGNIIVKGINEAMYKNVMNEINPNNKYISKFYTIKFNHTIEINVKDNKYRIIYTLTDVVTDRIQNYYSWNEWNKMIFSMIDFTGLKQKPVGVYNNYLESQYKKAMVGKKKRRKIQDFTIPIFEEMNKNVIAKIKLTMLLIEKTVNSTKKDDW